MLKKTITFRDYNGVEHTNDFYFHLSRAEILEMEVSKDEGLQEYLQRIVQEKDNRKILAVFKSIILKAYGVKSPDGKLFIKSQEVKDAFEQSEAYVELFMELCLNESSAVNFVNGILPENLVGDITRPAKQ